MITLNIISIASLVIVLLSIALILVDDHYMNKND